MGRNLDSYVKMLFRSLFIVLAEICQIFCMWPLIFLGNVAWPMIFSLFCGSFKVKNHDYGQDFHFYHKTKHKARDETSRPQAKIQQI